MMFVHDAYDALAGSLSSGLACITFHDDDEASVVSYAELKDLSTSFACGVNHALADQHEEKVVVASLLRRSCSFLCCYVGLSRIGGCSFLPLCVDAVDVGLQKKRNAYALCKKKPLMIVIDDVDDGILDLMAFDDIRFHANFIKISDSEGILEISFEEEGGVRTCFSCAVYSFTHLIKNKSV